MSTDTDKYDTGKTFFYTMESGEFLFYDYSKCLDTNNWFNKRNSEGVTNSKISTRNKKPNQLQHTAVLVPTSLRAFTSLLLD